MRVQLKAPFYDGLRVHEVGVRVLPDDTVLPSSAVILDAAAPVAAEPEDDDEPDTLSGLTPRAPLEKKK